MSKHVPELMKGETWADAQKPVRGQPRFTYPVFGEIKLDEIRLHVKRSEGGAPAQMLSYAGKPLNNLEPWASKFQAYLEQFGLHDLDCGVLVNGNFDDTFRYTRSKKVPADLEAADVQFLLFDCPESVLVYVERAELVDFRAATMRQHFSLPMIRPYREECHCEDDVLRLYEKARQAGHEGLMVKTPGHLYQRRRTFDWMKLKPKETHDGRITEVLRATSIHGEPLDRAGSVRVVLEDGSTADPSGIRHDLGREMLANPERFIGQWVEFTCMERDRAGGYRHPIFRRLREAK